MTILSIHKIRKPSFEEHLGDIAQLVDDELCSFAAEHGNSMLCGSALAPRAAAQFAQLARDYRLLMRTIEALPRRPAQVAGLGDRSTAA
jgi:hypothetical protein